MNEIRGVFFFVVSNVWAEAFGVFPSGGLTVDPPATEASTHFCHVDLVDRSSSAKRLVEVQAPVPEGRGSIRQIEPETTIHQGGLGFSENVGYIPNEIAI